MLFLGTDHLSFLEQPESIERQRLMKRLDQTDDELAVARLLPTKNNRASGLSRSHMIEYGEDQRAFAEIDRLHRSLTSHRDVGLKDRGHCDCP